MTHTPVHPTALRLEYDHSFFTRMYNYKKKVDTKSVEPSPKKRIEPTRNNRRPRIHRNNLTHVIAEK